MKMELYDSKIMPLSSDPEIKIIQEKQLQGEKLSISDKIVLAKKYYGADHTINKIGDYECKSDHCYRCIDENTLEIYKQCGYIKDERRVDYIDGQNNQGIDWYLGGAMPGNKYGYIIIECPADKEYFVPATDNGLKMSDDINVRHMKSSPQRKPIPISMITNVFDYKKIKEQAKTEFDSIRQQDMAKMAKLRQEQIASTYDNSVEKKR